MLKLTEAALLTRLREQERIMALTTRLELMRQALAGLQNEKGHRLAGITGAIDSIKVKHSEGASAYELEDGFALAFRVAELEALQQSLLEKENKELRELYGELVAIHDQQRTSQQFMPDANAQRRIADLEDRLRGQAEALNSKSLAMDTLRQQLTSQLDEQKARIGELLQNLKSVMRDKEAAEADARQARGGSAPSEREHWQGEEARLTAHVSAQQRELDALNQRSEAQIMSINAELRDAERAIEDYRRQWEQAQNELKTSRHENQSLATALGGTRGATGETEKLRMELQASQHENATLLRRFNQWEDTVYENNSLRDRVAQMEDTANALEQARRQLQILERNLAGTS
jgi:chromosome segregation ATPase